MIHPFKAIAKEYREGRKIIIETFYESGEVPNKISSKVFLFLCSIFDLIVITPYIKFCDLLFKKRISPFIREWILACVKWYFAGPMLFAVIWITSRFSPAEESWISYVLVCFVQIPIGIFLLITLFMYTPAENLKIWFSVASCGNEKKS